MNPTTRMQVEHGRRDCLCYPKALVQRMVYFFVRIEVEQHTPKCIEGRDSEMFRYAVHETPTLTIVVEECSGTQYAHCPWVHTMQKLHELMHSSFVCLGIGMVLDKHLVLFECSDSSL